MDKEAKSQVYVNLDDPHRVEYQKKEVSERPCPN